MNKKFKSFKIHGEDVIIIVNLEEIESMAEYYGGALLHMKSGEDHVVSSSLRSIIDFNEKRLTVAEVMTLRDHFAAAAIPAIIEKYGKVPMSAKWAYEVADDMMVARLKEGGES